MIMCLIMNNMTINMSKTTPTTRLPNKTKTDNILLIIIIIEAQTNIIPTTMLSTIVTIKNTIIQATIQANHLISTVINIM